MLNTFTLKNGIKVATYSIPEMKSIFLSQSVKGGSIFDEEGKSGGAHFMEHILFQGTPSFPNVETFTDYVEKLAGIYNASTSPQTIRFYISVPGKFLHDALQIGSEVFFEPLFTENSIARERNVILSEVRERQDSIWYRNSKFLASVRFKKGSPMLKDSGGTLESVEKLSRQDLVNYWSKFFVPANTYIVLVGGFDPQQAEMYMNKFFGKYQENKKFSGYPNFTNDSLSARKVAIRRDEDLKAVYVTISFPSAWNELPLNEVLPQAIIRSIFGGLRGSRLYRLLRQREGLVYDVSFGAVTYQKFGYAYVDTQVAKGKLDRVLSLIAKELKVFYENGPTEEEVEFAKNYLINRVLMSFDHPSGIADWIEGDLLWEEKIYTPEEYAKLVGSITLAKINAFIHKYWDFSKLNVVIQGPVENSSTNVKKYQKMFETVIT